MLLVAVGETPTTLRDTLEFPCDDAIIVVCHKNLDFQRTYFMTAAGEKISGFRLPQILSETPLAEIDETNLMATSTFF